MKCRKCRALIPENGKFCPACGARQDVAQNPKSRGNGQGSVYQLANKRWIAVKTIGYEPDSSGKMRRITRSKSGFRTKREALEYLPLIGTERETKTKSTTFIQLYDAWEPTHRAGSSTMDCYRAAKKHYQPLWHQKISDITVDDLQDCIDDCGKGKRTKENMKALAGLLYKYAIPRNIATLNMGQYLVVDGDHGTKEGLPLEAVKKIQAKTDTVEGADYVLCQCYLGFRPSEFLALDAKNYNRKERAFVGGAKTDAGKDRIVTVSPKIQPIIDRLTKDKLSGPIFCTKSGKTMNIRAYRKLFYDVLETCEIDNPIVTVAGVQRRKYTPHSCRHTFATLMKQVKAADKDKLELMGHTSTEMLRHYQDVSFEDLRRITDAL